VTEGVAFAPKHPGPDTARVREQREIGRWHGGLAAGGRHDRMSFGQGDLLLTARVPVFPDRDIATVLATE